MPFICFVGHTLQNQLLANPVSVFSDWCAVGVLSDDVEFPVVGVGGSQEERLQGQRQLRQIHFPQLHTEPACYNK